MSIVRTCLSLFGGDTVIVRCSDSFRISMINEPQNDGINKQASSANVISTRADGEVYLNVPYTGVWNFVIDAESSAPEHSIRYLPA
ncbi:hypothetical protein EDC48_110141 [Gibbsiella quercinecans]|uniref:DUF1883 domain-containing protein n=1 Tax=Gibbsiella quercinecans TaxID=929813 RepID=A0A250B7L1_9GAMM|nr:hypothetical protein [Gibbsiella quercinecans]ATA22131.1 hypothetical protein AWC35_23915 [Gibbsiella quercinecans]RLM04508.1 hypothetical protein BIY30_20230 [Gibbsiella quercinecans]RLM09301.1 hypothetical protein BIY31_10030 [Gibbsiella quercinecans]RLM16631.1 hypothetical protein BIY27_00655 [Gibbsiella quercinecans]TCT88030.1 hypothetical protein EDC48_110141 [Gibbsiella quercinecans]